MSADHAAALQQHLSDAGASMTAASVSLGALVASGGVTDAQMQAMANSITQSVNANMTAQLQAQLQPLQTQLQALSADLLATRVLYCKSYNATCGEGGARPYTPVPNAAGELSPHGEQPLRDRSALDALTMERAAAWCQFYGIATPTTLQDRKRAVAAELGVVVPLE
jgi:hypothetical protein